MKSAILMAIIPLSSMGLVNIVFADDSPPPSTTGEPKTVIDSPSKTQPPATAESPFSIGSIFSPHFGNDHFGATVGYKAWFNTWNLPFSPFGEEQEITVNVGSEKEIFHIPVVSLRYKNFFVSGSYFSKTDYNFRKVRILNANDANPFLLEWNISAKRSERDITAGYYVSQNIAITLGYKNIRRDYFLTVILNEKQNSRTVTTEIQGTTLGITGSVPLGRGFGLYETFSYGWLGVEGNEGGFPYYLGEMGLIYSLRFKNPTINAASFYTGYRFQRIDIETAKDRTDGFVLGVNLSF